MQLTKKSLEDAKKRLLKHGFSLSGYARKHGFKRNPFLMFMRGQWGLSGKGAESTKYTDALIKDGFLSDTSTHSKD